MKKSSLCCLECSDDEPKTTTNKQTNKEIYVCVYLILYVCTYLIQVHTPKYKYNSYFSSGRSVIDARAKWWSEGVNIARCIHPNVRVKQVKQSSVENFLS